MFRYVDSRRSTYIQTGALDVMVHTSMVSLEETVKVRLTAQPSGVYKFVCLTHDCTMLADSLRQGSFP